ncbi:MAG: hypothetical protein K1X66_05745 [Verrucomicrobiae bacterium]|nr:hypothetical protein [Verrucomicrobiae bacterium]
MKQKIIILLVVLTLVFVNSTQLKAQAERDIKIVGTYQCMIGPQRIPITFNDTTGEGFTFVLNGGLFTFTLNFSPLGFHEGRVLQGFLFVAGRKVNTRGSVLVLPFGSTLGSGTNIISIPGDSKNRNITFSFGPVEIPFIQRFSAELLVEGIMFYQKKAPGKIMRGNVEYTSDNNNMRVDFDRQTGVTIIRSSKTVPGVIVEAKKISTVPNFFGIPTTKVYR